MRLPPEPILVAAQRWLELLPTSGGVARAHAMLTNLPDYSDLTPTQYATALAWVREIGLLDAVGCGQPASAVLLRAVFERGDLAWVRDADVLVQSPDDLPTDILDAGGILGLGAADVYGLLCGAWGKVDTAARERVGAAGEAALVDRLRSLSDAKVEQVSSWSDGFGYDIAVTHGRTSAHLEVKSTTRLGRLTIHLSRNEYEVMLRDEQWVLVVVRLDDDLTLRGTGSVHKEWLGQNVPKDASTVGRWESCKFDVPQEVIESGVPCIANLLASPLPAW